MVSKKIFLINDCCFNLPDDFNGTCGDALMLLAQYRLEQEKNNKIDRHETFEGSAYKQCMSMPDLKASISYAMCELNDDGQWDTLTQKGN